METLLKIQMLVTSPVADKYKINLVKQLGASLIAKIISLYRDGSITKKFNYVVYLSKQLRKFGPIWSHSCIRLEGKNQLF